MSKQILLLFFFISPVLVLAQEPVERQYDFSNVDPASIDFFDIGSKIDSIWRASGADSLAQLGAYAKRYTYLPAYGGIDFGYAVFPASLTNLNSDLRDLGFPGFSQNFSALLWGFSAKSPRWLYSFDFVIGLDNKTDDGIYELSLSAANIDFSMGYDIVNHRRFQVYPQLTLGLQQWWLSSKYKDGPALSGDIGDLLFEHTESDMSKASFLLTYGAEADYHVKFSNGGNGIILALKYGLTANIIEGKWKISGTKTNYNSSDKIQEMRMAVVVRFYFK